MSNREIEDRLNRRLDSLKRISGLMYLLLGGAFSLGVWVASLEIRQRRSSENDTALIAVKEWMVEVNATRFRKGDFVDYERGHNEVHLLQEKRLQRLEDTQIRVEQLLNRLEDRLLKD